MTITIPLCELHAFGASLLECLGLSPEDAAVAADVLCYADARGLTTHGTGALATLYGPRLLSGRIDAAARPITVVEQGAIAVVDAKRGLGLVTMTFAMDLATALAQRFGVGAVTVRNSSHFGPAGYYGHRAMRKGLVGFAMTNCGMQGVVPPLGGRLRMLGSNPVGVAVPAGREVPFVLDMSTTVVATGKVTAATRSGASVPDGWLVGPDGADVNDPAAYHAGEADLRWLGGDVVTGGAKGYGLALLVDLLCGPLAGSGFGPRAETVGGGPPSSDDDIGHFALAIDPAAFGPPATFLRKVDDLLSAVRGCPPAAYATHVTYPGEPEARQAATAQTQGAALPEHLAEPLWQLATRLGVPRPRTAEQNRSRNDTREDGAAP